MSTFYKYFKQNMDGLGLPAPESLFGTVTSAVSNTTVILGVIDKFGTRVTIGEVIRAGTKLEALAVASACAAAYYVGAVIGSLAVATGRTLAGGTSLSDVLLTLDRYRLSRPWLTAELRKCPELYCSAHAGTPRRSR